MGYCYEGRKLCCDQCGHAGARKVPCPYGYCPASALCAECRKNPELKAKSRAYHEDNCKAASARYKAEEARKQALLAEGKAVLWSALDAGEKGVHVLFRKQDGTVIGRYVPSDDYRNVHGGGSAWSYATPETFPVSSEAPDDFQYERAA